MAIPFTKIASAVNSVLPDSISDEMRKSVHIAVESAISRMNLVTRSEIVEQERELLELRERIEAMEALVLKLEKFDEK